MQSPSSPVYSAAHGDQLGFPASPVSRRSHSHHHAGSNKIDYTKFKTKMCRNYALGIPCPFQARCAFSHGESDAERMARAQPQHNGLYNEDVDESGSSSDSITSPKAGGLYSRKHGSTDNFLSSNCSEGNSFASFNNTTATGAPVAGQNANAAEFLPPPPPSYEAALDTIGYSGAMMSSANGASAYGGIDTETTLPPAYPTRYRHNPYSFSGVIYE